MRNYAAFLRAKLDFEQTFGFDVDPADVSEVPQDVAGDPPVDEAAEAPEPQPEPTIVGHGVVQDNVSEPGQSVTRHPDGTEIGRTSVDDMTPQAVSSVADSEG